MITEPGNYVLTRDVDSIKIEASHVDVNLNGLSVDVVTNYPPDGLLEDITIRNGTVLGTPDAREDGSAATGSSGRIRMIRTTPRSSTEFTSAGPWVP